ncbi:MAG: DUF3793 family protein [Lachnospiraceae bacterium]|nr:DUF3793 family protein [Lachnospiraceae bacterium]
MPEKVLIENCSPTLAGIKTASLVNLQWEDSAQVMREMREMNQVFGGKGLRAVPLRSRKGCTLLYLYRPDRLGTDLKDERAQKCLGQLGYPCGSTEECVAYLAKRLQLSQDFPHEIGFFLGYPPEDVIGFMEHRDRGCKCVGTWRVYGDESAARKTFRKFRKCTDVYEKCWSSGRSILDLTVRGKQF